MGDGKIRLLKVKLHQQIYNDTCLSFTIASELFCTMVDCEIFTQHKSIFCIGRAEMLRTNKFNGKHPFKMS